MRNASPALIAFLNSLGPAQGTYIADLLTIIQTNGTITRITSADTNIQSTSQAISPTDPTVYTFLSGGVTFGRSSYKQIIGMEVDNMPITLMVDPNRDTLGGIPWPAAARNGALDGAQVIVERAFMPTWNDTSAGTLIIFAGVMGGLQASRTAITATIKAPINVLANQMPRNIYQPGCLHTVYDAGCTLLKASFTVTGAVVGTSSTTSEIITGLTQADHYFELGAILFTSGPLSGIERTVKTYLNASGAVTVVPPLPSIPGAGVTFSIYPGCDHLQATCSTKYSNLAHYRGYKYVPVPETAA